MVRIFWSCAWIVFIGFLIETFFGDGFGKADFTSSLIIGVVLGFADYLSDILSELKELKEELAKELAEKLKRGLIKELEEKIIEERIEGERVVAELIRKLESVESSLQDIESSISPY